MPLDPPDLSNYPGSTYDCTLSGAPIRDIISLDRLTAHAGFFPDSFEQFLGELGTPATKRKQIVARIVQLMRNHSYTMFKTYWKLLRDTAPSRSGETGASVGQETICTDCEDFSGPSPRPVLVEGAARQGLEMEPRKAHAGPPSDMDDGQVGNVVCTDEEGASQDGRPVGSLFAPP